MQDFKNDLVRCVEVLQSGGLILYPTDTVWGIGCDATNPQAIDKIFQLKKRPGEKSMIILVADEAGVSNYISNLDPGIFEYLRQSERPTTVIYENAIGLPSNLVNKDGSIAIRICKDEFCKKMIETFGKPVVSTSANISGLPVANNFSQVSDEIKSGVDYIVSYRQDDMKEAVPSAIIKWIKDKPIVIRS